MFNGNGEAFQLTPAAAGPIGGQGVTVSVSDGVNPATTWDFRYTSGVPAAGLSGTTYYFNTTESLRAGMQALAATTSVGATVAVDTQGKFILDNAAGASDLVISVAGIEDANTVKNSRFADTFATLSGNIPIGSQKQSQSVNATTHAASIDVYDSLGGKHTVRIDFRK
jgi:flagellar hook protein FlgE